MGDHIVPQAHLKRFACREPRDLIWMYDKEQKRFAKLKIKQVAQAPRFYSKLVEAELANKIEDPSNALIRKLRSRERLTWTERIKLSQYILTMATRGTAYRRRIMEEIGPSATKETFLEVEGLLNRMIEEKDHDWAKTQLPKLLAAKAKTEHALPQTVIDFARTPFWSTLTVEYIANMTWRLCLSPPGMFYITSDTPTHISRGAGVGTLESEVTFPISRDLALIGSHIGQPGTTDYPPAQPQIVTEVNNRVLNAADRFIFSHTNAQWIPDIAHAPPVINRISWIPDSTSWLLSV